LGSFYGARLARAGHDVHFLLRSDYEMVRQRGVLIRSVEEDFQVRPQCARHPGDIGPCEVVLIALKTTANAAFPQLLPPLIGQGSLVVTLQNGLGSDEALAALLGPDNILGGLCFVCLNRVEPGVIVHSAHGRIVLGEYLRPALERTHRLADLLRAAGIPCQVSENLAASRWEKLVWNVPFNGLGVAGSAGYEAVVQGRLAPGAMIGSCLPTDRLLDGGQWEQLVRELMREVIAGARAQGFPLAEDLAEEQIERTRIMQAYKASTLIDFERGLPLELDSMFQEPLRRARRAGVEAKRLSGLCEVLVALEAVRGAL